MPSRLLIHCVSLFAANFLHAQVYPRNNSIVNYTQVYVQDDAAIKADKYELQLFIDSIYSGRKFLVTVSAQLTDKQPPQPIFEYTIHMSFHKFP